MISLGSQLKRPRCPRCGVGKAFAGMLKIHDTCGACGLVLKDHDAGDGPTFFAILIVSALVMAGAGIVEYHFAPPMWVHAALWLPLTFGACIFTLRLFKIGLITLDYRLKAGEK